MGVAVSDGGLTPLVKLSTLTFTANSTVTITWSEDGKGTAFAFKEGLAHGTAGSFAGTPIWSDVTCNSNGSAAMMTAKPKGAIQNMAGQVFTWTAPSDVSSLESVTLSFAGAAKYGLAERTRFTLTKPTTTATGSTANGSTANGAANGSTITTKAAAAATADSADHLYGCSISTFMACVTFVVSQLRA